MLIYLRKPIHSWCLQLHKKGLVAAAREMGLATLRLQHGQELRHVVQGLGIEGVVDPAAFLAVPYETGIFEAFEMKGEARLSAIEQISQVTHTLLAIPQTIHNLQACFICQGVKPAGNVLG